ncbi:MmgE/PrpD family protein [Acidaminococcus massiliensis]|jgi:2-methylcitrate dehydratase PrpD|uniref:MmgE/PrpD family protein n=1 Tax=Acidaminococcus massiliensis TaxID=1852375 RepID=UPI00094EC052|nr:MmgE/PrpD family protein [Acidaminococcus massiliensis]
MNELLALAKFIAAFSLDECPPEVVSAAKDCVLDTVGISIGAVTQTMQRNIRQIYLKYDNYNPIKEQNDALLATVWGSHEKVNLRTAVFFNAMQGHTLEMDDVHTRSKTHIGTVVIPAAWGLSEVLSATGKDFLEAVICGYETMSRIGMGFGVSSHRNKGWHVTSTAGTFGAAAACAKLLHFVPEQIMGAFGMAGTQSCGTWAFLADGATNKVLHPARAAVSGLEACLLVQGGMKGSSYILDAKDGGIFPMMSDEYDYSLVSQNLGKIFELLQVDKKPYPCCRSTHCAIDAALFLKENEKIDIQNIRKVTVKTYLVGLKQCGLSETSKIPELPTQAKFSTPYVVACALTDGKVALQHFDQAEIQRKDLQNLLRKISVVEDPAFTAQYPNHWGCKMEIELQDGTCYTKTIPDASGSVKSPLTQAQLQKKLESCCTGFNKSWLEGIRQQILRLDTAELLPLLKYDL